MKKMKLIMSAVLLTTISFHSTGRAMESVEFGIDDVRALDTETDALIQAAGYRCDPSQLNFRLRNDSVEVTETSFRGECRTQPRDLISIGATVSMLYLSNTPNFGGNLSWFHGSKKKNKIIFHIDAGISGRPENYTLNFSYDHHVGKKGFFLGANAQLLMLENPYIHDTPAVEIPAVGAEAGWAKIWGNSGRINTSVKLGMTVAEYEEKNYMWFDGKLAVGVMLFKHHPKYRR